MGRGAPYLAGSQQASGAGLLADWQTRVLATLIDWAASTAVVIVGFILAAIAGAVSSALGLLVGLVVYLGAAAGSFYFGYMGGVCGQSPGKKVMGIKVIAEETGQPIGGGMGIVRQLAHIIDSVVLYIGWLLPLWDAKHQTLADKVMKTVVITGVPRQKLSPQLFKLSPVDQTSTETPARTS